MDKKKLKLKKMIYTVYININIYIHVYMNVINGIVRISVISVVPHTHTHTHTFIISNFDSLIHYYF